MTGLRTSTYWRERAEEARTKAAGMEGLARETLLDVARRYELMARVAAERERQGQKRRKPDQTE